MTATCHRVTAALALVAALASCELPPPGDDLDPGEPADVDCTACHVVEDLLVPESDAPPREWMAERGGGVVRDPAVLSSITGEPAISVFWPRRGHHGEAETEGCVACHPVYRRTSGHGTSQYAEEGRRAAFAPSSDCASACHDWLPDHAEALGFIPRSGARPAWIGSLRPGDLLEAAAAADLGHGRLWSSGYVAPEEPEEEQAALGLRVEALEAGCGGCHNRFADDHGAIATCTDCHDMAFGAMTGSHERHVARIDDEVERRVAEHADRPSCDFCHCQGEAPEALCRPACYNCHLGGHHPAPILWTGE